MAREVSGSASSVKKKVFAVASWNQVRHADLVDQYLFYDDLYNVLVPPCPSAPERQLGSLCVDVHILLLFFLLLLLAPDVSLSIFLVVDIVQFHYLCPRHPP